MRKLVIFFAVIMLISCSNRDNKSCDNAVLYGYVTICLPQIKGMTECSAHPIVQQITQQYLASGPVLGYYLNNEMYKQIYLYKPGETAIDEYFMIYGDYLRENYRATESDLEIMERNLAQTLFEGDNFNQISSKVEEVYGTLTPGKPVLLEKYSPHPNVRTMIVLIKYQNETGERNVVSAVDCILVKNRLMTLAYYVAYSGGKSIDTVKEKNNTVVKKLMEIN